MVKLGIAGNRPTSIPPPPPPAPCFHTVVTVDGLRVWTMASSPEQAVRKVHGAIGAWPGFEPLSVPDNDNAIELSDEDVIAWRQEVHSPAPCGCPECFAVRQLRAAPGRADGSESGLR